MTEPATKQYLRGACPSAGAPMKTGDGLLSRVRVPGGRLDSTQLERLAGLAESWGQPLLELTSRGNIQLRGLTPEGDAALTAALVKLGLAVAPAEAEAARNVLSTPAADLDPQAICDPWPIAEELDRALIGDLQLWGLPAKFRLLVDGGGATQLAQQYADIRADAVLTPAGPGYRLALAGSAATAQPLGLCMPDQASTALLALVRCFLGLNRTLPDPAIRLATVLENVGSAAFREALSGLHLEIDSYTPADRPRSAILGSQPGWFGCAVPFGQLSMGMARTLASLARERGNGQLRLTPWRQILLPGADAETVTPLRGLGLITGYGDPRLSVIACPGFPACQSGSTATRDQALAWARALPQLFDGELIVHVSGCGKGCARPMASPLTLTARNGCYDLILNDYPDPRHEASRLLSNLMPIAVLPHLRRLAEGLKAHRCSGESLAQVIERLGAVSIRQWFK